MEIKKELKNACPKCKSTNLTFYPLAYFADYKCNDCGKRFDDKDVLKLQTK